MTLRRITHFTFIAALAVLIAGSAAAGEFFARANAAEGRYIVVFKQAAVEDALRAAPGLSVAAEAAGLAQFHGGRASRVYDSAGFRGFLFEGDERAARALANDRRVAYVEPDGLYAPSATQSSPHWGLDRIDERDLPRNNHYTYGSNGANVNIYVLDTGINADADLSGRSFNSFTAITNANGVPQYGDCANHGTNVAKLAAGTTAGVAKGAKVYNVRIGSACPADCLPGGDPGPPGGPKPVSLGACGFYLSDILGGMTWVSSNRVRPAVANLSFGGPASQALDDGVRGMINAGVTVIASAGNDGQNACNYSPARVAEAVTVGASDISDSRAIFNAQQSSNIGACIDLWAPGKDVNGFSGTSASAPIVSGAAAIYLQTNTLASPATVASTLINNSSLNKLSNLGSGSPNRLVFVPPGGTETDALPNAGTFQCSCNGGKTCTFSSNFNYSDDFGVVGCRYLVDYDSFNRPIYRFGCNTSYTFKYTGPYLIEYMVQDDGGQWSYSTINWCQ
jgi:subtilisin family serine protease